MSVTTSDTPSRSYGPWIRAARERVGLTMEEAAKRAEMSMDGLSRIERGINGARMATLEKLADVYGVQIGDLLPHTSLSTSQKLVEPLLAALAGLEEDEIGAWMNTFAQQAYLMRDRAERMGRIAEHKLRMGAPGPSEAAPKGEAAAVDDLLMLGSQKVKQPSARGESAPSKVEHHSRRSSKP